MYRKTRQNSAERIRNFYIKNLSANNEAHVFVAKNTSSRYESVKSLATISARKRISQRERREATRSTRLVTIRVNWPAVVEPEWVQPWLCPHKHAANVACCARCCCTRDCLERAAIIRRSFAFRLSVTVTRSGYALQTPDAFRPRSLPPPFLPLFSLFSSLFVLPRFFPVFLSFFFFVRFNEERKHVDWFENRQGITLLSSLSYFVLLCQLLCITTSNKGVTRATSSQSKIFGVGDSFHRDEKNNRGKGNGSYTAFEKRRSSTTLLRDQRS